MLLKNVIKVLIDNGVLICDHIIKLLDVTGDTSFLGKRTIRHNEILEELIGLDIYTKLAKGPRQDETRKEFLLRAFSKE